MQKICVLSNLSKNGAKEQEKEIVHWLEDRDVTVLTPDHPYDILDQEFLFQYFEGVASQCEAVLVLGGDGTLLSVARQAAYYGLPLLGINLGRIGFLAELEQGKELFLSLERMLHDDYFLEDRMMLQVSIRCNGRDWKTYHCLNDGVILKDDRSGLIEITAYIDGKESVSYHADGIIVATPTGASGYSLSANGPLVSPEMEAIIVTPICAQSLYSRPVVAGADRVITVKTRFSEGGCYLSLDGKTTTIPLAEGDEILFKKSSMKTIFLRLNGKTFFDVLNEKLRDRR